MSHSEDRFNVHISKEPIKREIQRIIPSLGKALMRKTPSQEKCASQPHSKNQALIVGAQVEDFLKCAKSHNVRSVSFGWDPDEFQQQT